MVQSGCAAGVRCAPLQIALSDTGRNPGGRPSADLRGTPRLRGGVVACLSHHVIRRGNPRFRGDREHVFFPDDDCRAYREWLKAYRKAHAVAILPIV